MPMHHVDAEARRWQRQWVEWSEAGRIPDHRSKINNHGSWKLERICTMIALTYDCYYTTDMTLAGAGKRAHLAPGDRKHGRTFQGPSHAGPCVVNVADEKQARVSDVASHAASESQLAFGSTRKSESAACAELPELAIWLTTSAAVYLLSSRPSFTLRQPPPPPPKHHHHTSHQTATTSVSFNTSVQQILPHGRPTCSLLPASSEPALSPPLTPALERNIAATANTFTTTIATSLALDYTPVIVAGVASSRLHTRATHRLDAHSATRSFASSPHSQASDSASVAFTTLVAYPFARRIRQQ
ncbi:hypothetical protein Q7P36_010525 [Cladosporium allicinum]